MKKNPFKKYDYKCKNQVMVCLENYSVDTKWADLRHMLLSISLKESISF